MQEQVIKVLHKEGQGFVHVANVKNSKYDGQHEALEYAWSATNNKCGSWSKGQQVSHEGRVFENEDYNPDIEVLAPLPMIGGSPAGLRSSSVGDIFVISNDMFICSPVGFKPYP